MNGDVNPSRQILHALFFVFVFSALSQSVSAQQFVTIKYPGAEDTWVFGNALSNPALFTGTYVDANGFTAGFLFNAGTYTAIAPPPGSYTNAFGVNDLQQVVGNYRDGVGVFHGFLLSGSTYTTIDPPGSISTLADGINDAGQIVGYYEDSNHVYHGFLFSAGIYTTIDFPSASTTFAWRINNRGHIVGSYIESGREHGFVLSNGVLTTIDAPNSTFTRSDAINDADQVTGTYIAAGEAATQGFVYSAGNFTSVSVPSAASTYPTGLSNSGVLAGYFGTAAGINCDTAATAGLAGACQGFVGTSGPFAYVATGATGPCCTITVLDTNTNLVAATISIPGYGGVPFAVSPDQTKLYIANGSSVEVIDATTNVLTATISGVGPGANAVTIAPDGTFGYTANGTNSTTGSVSVFRTATNSVVASIPVTFGAGAVNVSADNTIVYVSGTGSVIAVINAATNKVQSTFSIPVPLGGFNGNFGPFITPAGSVGYVGQSVASVTPGTIAAISIPSNSILATIPVGTDPQGVAITPDGAYVYVGNAQSNNVSVIATAGNTVVATVPVGNQNSVSTLAITPDGATTYVANAGDNTLSLIQNSTNSVTATIPISGVFPWGIVIPAAPQTSQSITQPLSPTSPNTFNFGQHNFTVQYPAGTSFSGVNMTVVAAQATQQTFKQRVSGTPFVNATCIVYSGAGGNCVDYQVTCSSANGGTISCPSESSPTISVKTSFDTLQQIINPGFLTTPIGQNNWTNIFESFYLQRIDPTMKGRTRGFSEFVAVDLGASNAQGAGSASFSEPLTSNDERIFPSGSIVPVQFHLASIAHPGVIVTDAVAGLSVVQTSDSKGNSTANIVLDAPTGFAYSNGAYNYSLKTTGYAAGAYALTIYGNAFAAQQVQFTIPVSTTGAQLSTTLQSLNLNSSATQYVAVFKITNTGTAAANGVLATASTLNGVATATALPLGVGDISAGQSAAMTISYPISAGPQNSRAALTVSLAYAGGSSGVGLRLELP
jgi:YVTN family beta-propeller protein/probable HAF family extracellular repeat protein